MGQLKQITIHCLAVSIATTGFAEHVFEKYRGKEGPTGWMTHVVYPDIADHGPDGINFHDWDGDGDIDIFVNYEEGKYSRLYCGSNNRSTESTRQRTGPGMNSARSDGR